MTQLHAEAMILYFMTEFSDARLIIKNKIPLDFFTSPCSRFWAEIIYKIPTEENGSWDKLLNTKKDQEQFEYLMEIFYCFVDRERTETIWNTVKKQIEQKTGRWSPV